MLGEVFYNWVTRLEGVANYPEMLTAVLDNTFASLVEADVAVLEWDRDGKLIQRHGAPDHPHANRLEGGVVKCDAGTVIIQILSEKDFSEIAIDRFRVATLLVKAHLREICVDLYNRRVRERLFLARREAQSAAFVAQGRAIIPYNPAAVAFCDACWDADVVEHEMTEEQADQFWPTITSSWKNPVDPQWTKIHMDLGCGVMDIHAIRRHNGDAVIMFTPPYREPPEVDIPMLTRRQRDIMDWIAEGKTSAEAAIILDISPRTVEKHLEAIFQRFGVENRVAAVRTYLDLKAGIDPRLPGH